MRILKFIALAILIFYLYNLQGEVFKSDSSSVRSVIDFSLQNIDGRYLSLNDFPDSKGFIIVFTCNHCPFAKLYPGRLNKLNEKYAPLHVPLIAINSVDSLDFEEETLMIMKQKALENKFTFPYLRDVTQEVAKTFGADKTPHAFVIWKENNQWIIRYNGALDDNGAEPEKVTHAFVADAVDALLEGHKIKDPETNSIGCAIKFR
ncbi:MAG: thioredoxin family protein [Saprospiraceae bacterium]